MSPRVAVEHYSPTFQGYRWPGETYVDFDALTDEEIVDRVYMHELQATKDAGPVEYAEPGMRYGCFRYHHWDGVVDIHFANEENDDRGPLNEAKLEQRLRELHDLFAEIQEALPGATEVTGSSWLYQWESYRRLFPERYLSSAEIDLVPEHLGGVKYWGQFQDHKKGPRDELATQFLSNLDALKELTPETLRAAFPYQVLKVHGPINDFYEKYKIAGTHT